MVQAAGNIRIGPMKVTVGATNLGWTEGEGRAAITRHMRPQTCAEYGETPLDQIVTGHEIVVTVTLKEAIVANLKLALPEGIQGSTYAGIGGNVGERLSDHSAAVVLHPRNVADAVTTEDITIHKAVFSGPVELPFSYEADRAYEVQISGLLDTTKDAGQQLAKIAAIAGS